ncbi:TIGR04149 family rSAM-modified RiPP [Capnocytophaga felis]|uniref:Natural product, GG-Bacteroidales family domain protein n=1 Tax=Capnocytophaga felis TaxID=2267611 RepID=A0A5M4BC30_9FLAO|nr:TIGR04149 family rSAM-modified RiPP [Capnocytophaga felis]GET47030.1 hypothetical protein RCZ01_23320 [Capnocytophaga felis]GET49581.1 hypothetical protein RCZ02_24120 [Capnocytophaga felis]
MKSLKKLKLNQLREADLSAKEMSELKGGTHCCGCGCHGPSSTKNNFNANLEGGYSSVGGNKMCTCYEWPDSWSWSDVTSTH